MENHSYDVGAQYFAPAAPKKENHSYDVGAQYFAPSAPKIGQKLTLSMHSRRLSWAWAPL